MYLEGINAVSELQSIENVQQNKEIKHVSDTFLNMLDNTSTAINEAKAMSTDMVLGNGLPTHEIIIATEKAKLELQLLIEVRNKLLEGYQEVMRMQV